MFEFENFNSVESHRIKIDEVGYNRFTMTPNRWKKDNIQTEKEACNTHNKIGKIVRKAIKEAGRNYARRITYT